MTVKSRSRARHASSIVAVVLMLGALVFACADEKFGLGEDCIKDGDCQSGICTALKCTAAPPILDRDATPAPHDATSDAPVDSGGDTAPMDSAADTAAETGTD